MEHFELAVIGGGQAGANAACEAAKLGLKVTLIEENPVAPEWMRLQVPLFYGSRIPESLTPQQVYRWISERPLLQEAANLGVDVRTQHVIWGSFPGRTLGLNYGDRTWLADAERVIFATGAGDIPLAFSGWTLSGVMGAAGANALLETFGYIQTKRMLILGSGNLALRLAVSAVMAGIEVAGIVEAGPKAAADPALTREVERVGIPFFLSHTIKEARGQLEVEEVVLAQVDAQSEAPIKGSERVVTADSVCIAIGLAPAIELPYLSRCEMGFDSDRGGYFPIYDDNMKTSQGGIFVAGGVSGLHDTLSDGEIAAQQGVLAAIAAAESLSKLGASEAARRKEEVYARLKELGVSAAGVGQQSDTGYVDRWLQAAFELMPSDAPICRCEEVPLLKVLDGLKFVGTNHPDEVKRVTRCGMGFCQGRDCRLLLASFLSMKTGRSRNSFPSGSYRAPVRPIKLATLATEEETEYDRANTLEPGVWMQHWFPGLC